MQTNREAADLKLEKAVDDFVACADKFTEEYNCTAINLRSKEKQSQIEHCQILRAKADDTATQQQEQVSSLKSTIQTQMKELQSIQEELEGLYLMPPLSFARDILVLPIIIVDATLSWPSFGLTLKLELADDTQDRRSRHLQ